MVVFADATSVKMDYLPTGFARVDPILRDDCLSDHVHTFYGPQSGVDPRRISSSNQQLELHAKLLATDISENTGNVEENKSLYWHPTVYKYNRKTNTYTRDIMAQSTAYYVWETGQTTAFPNGFRMIGGFDVKKSNAFAECVNESPCDGDDCYTESTFFPSSRCDELEVSMRLPNCWDGISLDSPPSHTDHVAYAEGSEFDGPCPASHPIKVPQIQLFFRILDYDGGWHTFADGSDVFHSDYVSGWDESFLQNVLDNCENEGVAAQPNFFCEEFLTYRDAPKCTDEETCDFSDPNLLEKIKAFQPETPLDVTGTIVAEETAVVVGQLPRGTCNGSLVGDDNIFDNTNNPTSSPTRSPTLSPTLSPSRSPIDSGDNDSNDETSNSSQDSQDTNDGSEDGSNNNSQDNESQDQKRCRDIASNEFNLPKIGRVKERPNSHCRWFRNIYKNKRIKKKLCNRKVKITKGPKRNKMIKLNLVCKRACMDLGVGNRNLKCV